MLDAVGSLLSGGRATHQIDGTVWAAGQVSQVFIAIDVRGGSSSSGLEGIERIVRDLHTAQPAGLSFFTALCCARLPAHYSSWHGAETFIQSERQAKGCTEQEWQTPRREAWQSTQSCGTQFSNFGDLHKILLRCTRMHGRLWSDT